MSLTAAGTGGLGWDDDPWGGLRPAVWEGARGASACALHLLALLVLFAVVGVAALVMTEGVGPEAALSRLPVLLAWWVPSAVGIAGASLSLRREALGDLAVLLALGAIAVVGLDLWGALAEGRLSTEAVLNPSGDSSFSLTRGAAHPASWVLTITYWLSGGLAGASERLVTYPLGHARPLVAQALIEASTVVLSIGTLGAVVAIRRWIHDKIQFRQPGSDLTVHLLAGWLVAPAVAWLTTSLSRYQFAGALFTGHSLGSVLLPCLTAAALGVLGLVYAYREPRLLP